MRETHLVHSPMPTPCHRESMSPWSLQAHIDLARLLVATDYLVPTPVRPTRDPLATAATSCSICLAHLRCSSLHSSQVFTLIFPSKPNKMFVTLWSKNLRFIESRNCACVVRPCGLVVFHVCVFCACVVNCDDSMLLLPVIFFFFFWLFGFVTLSLYVCDSLSLVYIDKSDRERDRE